MRCEVEGQAHTTGAVVEFGLQSRGDDSGVGGVHILPREKDLVRRSCNFVGIEEKEEVGKGFEHINTSLSSLDAGDK